MSVNSGSGQIPLQSQQTVQTCIRNVIFLLQNLSSSYQIFSLFYSVDLSLSLCLYTVIKISVSVARFLSSVPFGSNCCFCLDWETLLCKIFALNSFFFPFLPSHSAFILLCIILISEWMQCLQIESGTVFLFYENTTPRFRLSHTRRGVLLFQHSHWL